MTQRTKPSSADCPRLSGSILLIEQVCRRGDLNAICVVHGDKIIDLQIEPARRMLTILESMVANEEGSCTITSPDSEVPPLTFMATEEGSRSYVLVSWSTTFTQELSWEDFDQLAERWRECLALAGETTDVDELIGV